MSTLSQDETFRPSFGWTIAFALTLLFGLANASCTEPIASVRTTRGTFKEYDAIEDHRIDQRPLFIFVWIATALPLALVSARLTWLKARYSSTTLTYDGDPLRGGVISGKITFDSERTPRRPVRLVLELTSSDPGQSQVYASARTTIEPRESSTALPFSITLEPPRISASTPVSIRFKAREGVIGWAARFSAGL